MESQKPDKSRLRDSESLLDCKGEILNEADWIRRTLVPS